MLFIIERIYIITGSCNSAIMSKLRVGKNSVEILKCFDYSERYGDILIINADTLSDSYIRVYLKDNDITGLANCIHSTCDVDSIWGAFGYHDIKNVQRIHHIFVTNNMGISFLVSLRSDDYAIIHYKCHRDFFNDFISNAKITHCDNQIVIKNMFYKIGLALFNDFKVKCKLLFNIRYHRGIINFYRNR